MSAPAGDAEGPWRRNRAYHPLPPQGDFSRAQPRGVPVRIDVGKPQTQRADLHRSIAWSNVPVATSFGVNMGDVVERETRDNNPLHGIHVAFMFGVDGERRDNCWPGPGA